MNKITIFILPLFFLCTACATLDGFCNLANDALSVGLGYLGAKIDNTESGRSYSTQAENTNKRLADEIAELEQERGENPEKAAYYDEEIKKRNLQKQETKMSAVLLDFIGIDKNAQELGQQFYYGDKYDKREVVIDMVEKQFINLKNKSSLGSKEEEGAAYADFSLREFKVLNNCAREQDKAKTPEERKVAMDKCKKEYADTAIAWAQEMSERGVLLAQLEKEERERKKEEEKNRLLMSINEAQQYANAPDEEKIAWINRNWSEEEFDKKIEKDGRIYDLAVQKLIDAEEHRKAEEESKSPEIAEEENKDSENAEEEDNNENEEVEEVESNEQIDETYSSNYEATSKQNAIEAIRRTQINSYKINSFDLTQEQKNSLDEVAKLLSDNGDLSVTIIGHTCSMGSSYVNKLVGKKRAETVKKYLVKKGVSSSRITISTKGESEPVDSNDTSQGRQANRRIEFRVD